MSWLHKMKSSFVLLYFPFGFFFFFVLMNSFWWIKWKRSMRISEKLEIGEENEFSWRLRFQSFDTENFYSLLTCFFWKNVACWVENCVSFSLYFPYFFSMLLFFLTWLCWWQMDLYAMMLHLLILFHSLFEKLILIAFTKRKNFSSFSI
jgi:hypothetical protein